MEVRIKLLKTDVKIRSDILKLEIIYVCDVMETFVLNKLIMTESATWVTADDAETE